MRGPGGATAAVALMETGAGPPPVCSGFEVLRFGRGIIAHSSRTRASPASLVVWFLRLSNLPPTDHRRTDCTLTRRGPWMDLRCLCERRFHRKIFMLHSHFDFCDGSFG